jgi:hypothetical protein
VSEVARLPSGRFVKGAPSPNPQGRRRTDVTVEALAKSYSVDAIRRLARLSGIDRDANGRLLPGARSEATQVHALNSLLNRSLGLPKQTIETNDPASPVLLHLLAAESVAHIARMERRTLAGHAEPGNGATSPRVVDLSTPPPLE